MERADPPAPDRRPPAAHAAAEERLAAVRQAVFSEAIPLLIERGFDNVTVEEIADRVGVSRRTIFRHFPTKADIVLNWNISEGKGLRDSLARQPSDKPLFARLRAALDDFIAEYRADHDWHVRIGRLSASTPALRARAHEKFEFWEDMLCDQIAMDQGGAEPTPEQRLMVALFMAVYRHVVRQWLAEEETRPVQTLFDNAFDAIPVILCGGTGTTG
jgi:AcrR family transcriptional regulator